MGERDPLAEMLAVNTRQQDYYESRHEAKERGLGAKERAANTATRGWTALRRRIQKLRSTAGVSEYLLDLHREWLGDLTGKRVLDLGCFDGNALSLWIAERAGEYVGLDLSEHAIAALNEKLAAAGFENARGVARDFLANGWPDGYFDAIYAYSVLHHFRDIDVALAEVRRLLKPGGVVVTMDPMKLEPFNRLARAVYRPLQTDRDWEWPFDRKMLDAFIRHLDLVELRGIQGLVKLAYPLLLVPGLDRLGQRLGRRLIDLDDRHARSFSFGFYLCWHVAMKLRRPAD
jgi:SAM-dependent methyltransferase